MDEFHTIEWLLGILAVAFMAWAGVVWKMGIKVSDNLVKNNTDTLVSIGQLSAKVAAIEATLVHLTAELDAIRRWLFKSSSDK